MLSVIDGTLLRRLRTAGTPTTSMRLCDDGALLLASERTVLRIADSDEPEA